MNINFRKQISLLIRVADITFQNKQFVITPKNEFKDIFGPLPKGYLSDCSLASVVEIAFLMLVETDFGL